jgi:hypothetical protein
VATKAVYGQHGEREQDPITKIGDPEHVGEGFEELHGF